VCCQVEVEVFASGWSLVQRSFTECGVSECDREASIMMRPRPTRGCCAMEKIIFFNFGIFIKIYGEEERYRSKWSRLAVIVTKFSCTQ
jgi:hypothetical protein